MKNFFLLHRRKLALAGVLIPLLALLVYVALRSGPLAPVPVAIIKVESRAIAPALFGIGTVEARYTYKIGPTFAGRVKRVEVQVGDQIKAGQLLGEMDPVDLDERIKAQEAALKRAAAQLREAETRLVYAQTQARRYEQLLQARTVSEEIVEAKRQELQVADASLSAAREELSRVRAERDGLAQQRANLRLTAPVAGLVTARNTEPSTTVIAGQTVVEVIDPASLWINVRFDQARASGLRAGLSARIVLRSLGGQAATGQVVRVEPLADAVTEETLAKVAFDTRPQTLPPVGELAEVTVALPALPALPVVPNASVQRQDGQLGVWVVEDGALRFAPVTLGMADLDGQVQIRAGLKAGERVVTHSQRALNARSRIKVVDRLPGVAP
ncbi:MAG: efflux RND transporter periplasmic adaptor subunit [Sulfuricella sp.]|nr:efflux RND transporter periplasmic adaptor subunit [Sulfuricella sp.]